MPYGSKLHILPTNYHLLGAQQDYAKQCIYEGGKSRIFSRKKSGEWTISRKEDKTERATGLARNTRQETCKENRVTALRFQTGAWHQTSLASLLGRWWWTLTWLRRALGVDHWRLLPLCVCVCVCVCVLLWHLYNTGWYIRKVTGHFFMQSISFTSHLNTFFLLLGIFFLHMGGNQTFNPWDMTIDIK